MPRTINCPVCHRCAPTSLGATLCVGCTELDALEQYVYAGFGNSRTITLRDDLLAHIVAHGGVELDIRDEFMQLFIFTL